MQEYATRSECANFFCCERFTEALIGEKNGNCDFMQEYNRFPE